MIGGRRVSEGFDTETQAVQFRDAAELDARLRKHGLPGLIRRRPTLAQVVRDFLELEDERVRARTLAERTLETSHQRLRGWLLWLETIGRLARSTPTSSTTCLFRRIRPAIPIESDRLSERSDAGVLLG